MARPKYCFIHRKRISNIINCYVQEADIEHSLLLMQDYMFVSMNNAGELRGTEEIRNPLYDKSWKLIQ